MTVDTQEAHLIARGIFRCVFLSGHIFGRSKNVSNYCLSEGYLLSIASQRPRVGTLSRCLLNTCLQEILPQACPRAAWLCSLGVFHRAIVPRGELWVTLLPSSSHNDF